MRNIEMEDSVSASNDSLKENFLLDFSKSADFNYSLTQAKI